MYYPTDVKCIVYGNLETENATMQLSVFKKHHYIQLSGLYFESVTGSLPNQNSIKTDHYFLHGYDIAYGIQV